MHAKNVDEIEPGWWSGEFVTLLSKENILRGKRFESATFASVPHGNIPNIKFQL